MSKRDYIQEILAKKQRSFFEGYRSSIRLYELEGDFYSIRESNLKLETFSSIYLVGIASTLEIAVRNAIKRFIDSGSPYIERVDKFKDFFKFDLNTTKALHDKQITFGEFISHFLPVKNVENINSHFGILLNGNFSKALGEIRHFIEPTDEELIGNDEYEIPKLVSLNIKPPELIVADVNSLMASLERLFTTRHIIAHEANFELVSDEDLSDFFDTARNFIDALEEIVEQTLNPNVPRGAFGGSLYNAEKAGEVYREMEEAYKKLHDAIASLEHEYFKLDIKTLENSQEAFNKYLEAELAFEESVYMPISGNALRNIEARIYSTLSKQRTERLKDALESARFLE